MAARYQFSNPRDIMPYKRLMDIAWKSVVKGIAQAPARAIATNPDFVRWFGSGPAQALARTKLTQFADSFNRIHLLTITRRSMRADADEYAHVYTGGRAPTTASFIYLGPQFDTEPSAWCTTTLTNYSKPRNQVETLAHELSHLIILTNSGSYRNEYYEDHAWNLALGTESICATKPDYAAYNADNYGFFIEACSL